MRPCISNNRRNKQTRDASRLYRQRKKATEQNLAEQVAQLARENNAILEENNKLLPQIIELSFVFSVILAFPSNSMLKDGERRVEERR